jgi:hypothetical protein
VGLLINQKSFKTIYHPLEILLQFYHLSIQTSFSQTQTSATVPSTISNSTAQAQSSANSSAKGYQSCSKTKKGWCFFFTKRDFSVRKFNRSLSRMFYPRSKKMGGGKKVKMSSSQVFSIKSASYSFLGAGEPDRTPRNGRSGGKNSTRHHRSANLEPCSMKDLSIDGQVHL